MPIESESKIRTVDIAKTFAQMSSLTDYQIVYPIKIRVLYQAHLVGRHSREFLYN